MTSHLRSRVRIGYRSRVEKGREVWNDKPVESGVGNLEIG